MENSLREKLSVVADDFGIRTTAEPILRLVRAGKVNRVAVLTRYVSMEHVEALKEAGVKIDLHLEIIHLLKRGEQVNDNIFLRLINFVARYLFGMVSDTAVEKEWREQLKQFQEFFGRLPDGLNSHEHVHYFPSFFPIFLKLAREYGIPYVRFGRQGVLPKHHGAFVGRILGRLWSRNRPFFEQSGLSTSDYMVSLDWLSDVSAFAKSVPGGTTELVVHPERPKEYQIVSELF